MGPVLRNADGSTPRVVLDGTSAPRVLVVDDERSIAELLSMALRDERWEVRTAGSGAEAIEVAREFCPEAVVLDVMLPDIDGLEVLRRLRAEKPLLPVLFLTARDDVADRIAALSVGESHYLTKPFSLGEVAGRLREVLPPSSRPMPDAGLLAVGDLVLDEKTREVSRGGERVHLTGSEFELLRCLMHQPGRMVSKAQIIDRVWQYQIGVQGDMVDLYISYLRRKIDRGRKPMIHSVKGEGNLLESG
jgi:two-component system, OmpR family, response regulator